MFTTTTNNTTTTTLPLKNRWNISFFGTSNKMKWNENENGEKKFHKLIIVESLNRFFRVYVCVWWPKTKPEKKLYQNLHYTYTYSYSGSSISSALKILPNNLWNYVRICACVWLNATILFKYRQFFYFWLELERKIEIW